MSSSESTMAVPLKQQVNELAEGPRATDVEYHTVEYQIHFEVSASELADTEDGGQRLVLSVGNGRSISTGDNAIIRRSNTKD